MTYSENCSCGVEIPDLKPLAELVLAGSKDGIVVGAQRMFQGTCPQCGPRLIQHSRMGHHTTYGEAQMQRRYPKLLRPALKAHLEPADGRRFANALHGRVHALAEDIARWDAAAEKTGATRRSVARPSQ